VAESIAIGKTACRTVRQLSRWIQVRAPGNGRLRSIEREHQGRWHALPGYRRPGPKCSGTLAECPPDHLTYVGKDGSRNSLISAPKFIFIASLLGRGAEGAGLEGLVCFPRQTVYERRTKALRD